ncbi:MAG: deoxyribonuclease IV [Mycoplasmoidaceae bacterium]
MQKIVIIGSHVSYKANNYLIGSVNETINNKANCFMIFSGPPQNSLRKEIDLKNVEIAHKMMEENGINLDNCIIHAPYIINLGSPKEDVYEMSICFLEKELNRTEKLGFKYIVLHPGSCLLSDRKLAIEKIANGINRVFEKNNSKVSILIETMSGKGSEIGININEIKNILDIVILKERIGVCLDTCHLWDSGHDISNPDIFLDNFSKHLDIKLIKAIHLNDSKNEFFSKKDRHENIGYGKIGFSILKKWVHCERLKDVPKILETPYYLWGNKLTSPYKDEIGMLINHKFNDFKKKK